jgi:hypothetical protein
VFWFLTTPTRRLLHEMVGAFAAMLLFYGSAWLFSGTQLRSLRRVVLFVPLNPAWTTTARS